MQQEQLTKEEMAVIMGMLIYIPGAYESLVVQNKVT